MSGGVQQNQTEAMTRFELVIKSFADPWLRPLTHIALQKKHPGSTEESRCTHSPPSPHTTLLAGARMAGEITLEGYRSIEFCTKQVILCCNTSMRFRTGCAIPDGRRQTEGSCGRFMHIDFILRPDKGVIIVFAVLVISALAT